MLTSQDYKEMANRTAQLAIECDAPTVAEALMALALDYMTRAARVGGEEVSKQQTVQEPADGFGD